MIGKLKRYGVRDVHGTRVARLEIDIPIEKFDGGTVNDMMLQRYLEANVGSHVQFDIGAVSPEQQTFEEMMEL